VLFSFLLSLSVADRLQEDALPRLAIAVTFLGVHGSDEAASSHVAASGYARVLLLPAA
jgi:hypothetical protein